MSINIREGDTLVVGTNEYMIRSCGEWAGLGSSPSFLRMASVTASTKRPPAVVGVIRGPAQTVLSNISITPLDPVDQELRAKVGIESANELLQTFAADATGYVHLVIEDLKNG